ncbi:probable transposable element [Lasallia pustulata]|uniref:Probable transposable element n=1 Tax=Lasallia pustulata TaxID=136370 RepID=A0A1W5CS18_9LECA|nr:probable transposable element [Lasallia pustulata]
MAEYRPAHIDAKDAIAFAAIKMKEFYDSRHKSVFFKVGDLVNLHLHCGFTVPAIQHKKIQQQFVGPFQILERIRRLAYRLELPDIMRIHPVINVAHLEPATKPDEDPFRRPRPQLEHPLPVVVDGKPEFEIERLLH